MEKTAEDREDTAEDREDTAEDMEDTTEYRKVHIVQQMTERRRAQRRTGRSTRAQQATGIKTEDRKIALRKVTTNRTGCICNHS
jgi:hypothetical protein